MVGMEVKEMEPEMESNYWDLHNVVEGGWLSFLVRLRVSAQVMAFGEVATVLEAMELLQDLGLKWFDMG